MLFVIIILTMTSDLPMNTVMPLLHVPQVEGCSNILQKFQLCFWAGAEIINLFGRLPILIWETEDWN